MASARSNLAVIVVTAVLCISLIVAHDLQYDSDFTAPFLDTALNGTGLSINSIPFSTRIHWMREANNALFALSGPCPFAAFGSVIVNHTGTTGLGELVCMGANSNSASGNPTMHGQWPFGTHFLETDGALGEIAAITNCSKVLTDPQGLYKLTPTEALAALSDLSIYTNAESCPMCASAIRWGGFKNYIYGTSIETLIKAGWGQIRISSLEIFKQSFELPGMTRIIGDVLTNETDPLVLWQFDPAYPCPMGCARSSSGTSCGPS